MKMIQKPLIFGLGLFLLSLFGTAVSADMESMEDMPGMEHMHGHSHHHDPYRLMMPSECGNDAHWDPTMGSCATSHLGSDDFDWHLHGQAFALETFEQGPRGRNAFSAPDMLMSDFGHDVGAHHLNLHVMLTAEKWTFPDQGTPLLLQVGETDAHGDPFIDAQHPHSSPIMGLRLSDTVQLGSGSGKPDLTVAFAPRGDSTDGPIPFMHRPTSWPNPDVPLGHHIGQDVGHISSTVISTSLAWDKTILEASGFHGAEPEPENIDLPLGQIDSFGFRASEELSPYALVMGSFAYVQHPEPDVPDISHELRYSLSLYTSGTYPNEPPMVNALIFGAITNYDHAQTLFSITEELLRRLDEFKLFGRFELLQRTPDELGIAGVADPNLGRWVSALTVGFSYCLFQPAPNVDFDWGGSVTKDLIPGDLIGPYGGNPWSGRVFLRLSGMGGGIF